MTGRLLKISRIVVSLFIFVALTLLLVCSAAKGYGVAGILGRWQFIPAALAFNMGVFCFWLLLTLMFGRVYCSSICPLGTLQDIIARIAMWLRPSHKRLYRYAAPLNALRYLVLTASVVVLMGGIPAAIAVIDPYSAYAGMIDNLVAPVAGWCARLVGTNDAGWCVIAAKAGVTGILLSAMMLAVVVIFAAVTGRRFCNTLCPVGATLSLISRHSVFHIDIDTDKCIQCHRCEHACKAHCIDLRDHVVDSSRCINCFDCLPVCPNDAISYTSRRKQLSVPMMQRLSMERRRPSVAIGGADKYTATHEASRKAPIGTNGKKRHYR